MSYLNKKEELSCILHQQILVMTCFDKEFNFIAEADELMNIYQNETEENYTIKTLLSIEKKVKKLNKANKLQIQINDLLNSL